MSRITRRTVLGLCAASGLIASGLATPVARAQDTMQIRVGILKIGGQTNAYVAEKEGFFKKHGLDAKLVNVRSGSDGMSAMQGGSLDIAITIPGFGLMANARGLDLVMVLQNQVSATTPPDTGAVLVSPKSDIHSLKDLAGKLIGINARHAQEQVSVQHSMRKMGVALKDIRYYEVPFPAMGAALARGDVQAVISVEPFVTFMKERKQGRIIAWNYAAIPGEPTGSYWAKRSWAEAHPKAIERFAAAIEEANAYLADPAKARAAVAAYTGLKPELVAKMPPIPWSTKVVVKNWEALIQMFVDEGEIQKTQRPEDFIWSLRKSKS